MRALYLSGGQVEVRDLPVPARPPGEALIRVRLAGICDTDLHLKAGYMDFEGIPGHEFVGEVVESEQPELVGRRVVGEINAACGTCDFCRRGLGRHCASRTVLGILGRAGAHAEYLVLPNENLHLVPDTLSDEEAVFTEPLAAACEILEQVHIEPTARVAVVGDGKLGLLIARVLALTGCDLYVIGRHARKLGLLARQGIATEQVAPGEESRLPSRWADVVVECSGSPSGFETARRLLKPRGTLVLKSTYRESPPVYLAGLVVDEITVVGSRCGPFEPALRLLEHRLVRVTDLVEDVIALREGKRAYERAAQRGVLKVLLDPGR